MRPLYRSSLLLLLALPIAFAGCGGSDDNNGGGTNSGTNTGNDGGGSASRVTSGIVINWSERTRAVNAFSAPLSARISFTRPGANADVSYTVDRRDALTSYSDTYLTPTPIPAGGTTIQVDFYANKGASGSLVSTARFSAVVRTDGTLATIEGGSIGNISPISNIETVTIQAPTSLEIKGTAQLNAVARDAAGNIVALAPGAFNFQNAGNGSLITITPAGVVTGVRPGTATVRATVDGKTSEVASIAIQYGALSGITVIEGATTDIVYSAARDRLYVATTSEATNPNAILSYVTTTGALDSVYRLGGRLGVLASSADGGVLYASLRNGSAFQRLDTATGQVGSAIPLGAGLGPLYAEDIVVSPTDPNIVAVSKAREGFSPRFEELSLYVNGVEVTGNNQYSISNALAFSSDGTELYGYGSEISNYALTAFTVTSSGLTQTRQREYSLIGGRTIQASGDRIYSSEGSVYNRQFDRIGRFDTVSRSGAFAVDAATNRVYYASSNNNELLIEIFDASTFNRVASRTYSLAGGPNQLVLVGANRIAVSVNERVYVLDLSVG